MVRILLSPKLSGRFSLAFLWEALTSNLQKLQTVLYSALVTGFASRNVNRTNNALQKRVYLPP
jgi:hypothetical protein